MLGFVLSGAILRGVSMVAATVSASILMDRLLGMNSIACSFTQVSPAVIVAYASAGVALIGAVGSNVAQILRSHHVDMREQSSTYQVSVKGPEKPAIVLPHTALENSPSVVLPTNSEATTTKE